MLELFLSSFILALLSISVISGMLFDLVELQYLFILIALILSTVLFGIYLYKNNKKGK